MLICKETKGDFFEDYGRDISFRFAKRVTKSLYFEQATGNYYRFHKISLIYVKFLDLIGCPFNSKYYDDIIVICSLWEKTDPVISEKSWKKY